MRVENEYLCAEINEKGAEITSLKSKATGTEYIWCGDPSVWLWHAPVLFPVCGNYKAITGLPQHGFLRDVQHIANADGDLVFECNGHPGYPYAFKSTTRYKLDGKKLTHSVTITNTGDDVLPFSLGFHTGFAVNQPKIEFDGTSLEFPLNTFGETLFYPEKDKICALVSDKDGRRIRYSSSTMNDLVIWTINGAEDKFICIESRFDTVGVDEAKPYLFSIKNGDSVELCEEIEILE